MTTELPSQIGLAAAASYAIQFLKDSPKFAWIGQHTSGLNRALAVVTSLIAAVGINYSYTHTNEGTWVITLTGLSLASVGHYAWAWFVQFALQQGYFKAVVKQPDTSDHGTDPIQLVPAVRPQSADVRIQYFLGEAGRFPQGGATCLPRSGTSELY